MEEVKKLLLDLHSEFPDLRNSATASLWEYWYYEAGEVAEAYIRKGEDLLGLRRFDDAQSHFEKVIKDYPLFAEAHNKLATVFYLLGHYENSVSECKVTLKMNPHHFGAWHGMGLCLFKLGRYSEAIESFKSTLEIQPYANINRKYIAICMGNLN
jgi:tetratricopeptide (TPR) repeat protein